MTTAVRALLKNRNLNLRPSIDMTNAPGAQMPNIEYDSDEDSNESFRSEESLEARHRRKSVVARFKEEDRIRRAIDDKKRPLIARKSEKVGKLRKHLKINDTAAAAIVIVGLIISFIENENHYSNDGKERNESSTFGQVLRGIVSVLTSVLIVLVIRHSVLLYTINREKLVGADNLNMSFWRSKYLLYMIIEVILNIVHWPPGIDKTIEFRQLDGKLLLSMDSMCLCWMILRSYLVFRLFKHYTKWAN
jgi:hypothetical protein